MKLVVLLIFLVSAALGQPQAPTNLNAIEQASTPTLGSVLFWSPVPRATYNVYRSPNNKCEGTLKVTKIASGLTATSFTDNPTPALPLGPECYAVTAVVAGVESAYSNFASDYLGTFFYFAVHRSGGGPGINGIGGVIVTLYQDGVALFSLTSSIDGYAVANVRLLHNSSYSIGSVLPSGTGIVIPAPVFGSAYPQESIELTHIVVGVNADESVGRYVSTLGMEPTL